MTPEKAVALYDQEKRKVIDISEFVDSVMAGKDVTLTVTDQQITGYVKPKDERN